MQERQDGSRYQRKDKNLKPESVKFMIFDNQLAYCKLVS
jgi:hypothetical protein